MAKDEASCLAFYYAKIGKGNQYASKYLKGENELKAPCIPIYFSGGEPDRDTFLASKSSKEQGEDFFNCADKWSNSYVVVIYGGNVSIWKPVPNCVVEFKNSEVDNDFEGMVKLMKVKKVMTKSVKDVPPIVAGINANRYYSSGTFREIDDPGNVLALTIMLVDHGALKAQHDIGEPTLARVIECLSSVQFETLIAKIFEEHGCFVPAYKGGTVKGIDLTARNDTAGLISIGGFKIEHGKTVSVQVKLRINPYERQRIVSSEQIDLLVWEIYAEGPSLPESKWLEAALSKSPQSRDWLLKSIDWLPKGYQELVRSLC